MVKSEQYTENTEARILKAARTVFLEKGFDGARMQQIADEAGINKALLHYYYRSKDRLFEAIFKEAFRNFLPGLHDIMKRNSPLRDKISAFIDQYFLLLLSNPDLPVFILHEIQRNPAQMAGIFLDHIHPNQMIKILEADMAQAGCGSQDARQLLVHIVSMIIFPFAGKPVLKQLLFKGNDKSYETFLKKRKNEIKTFTYHALGI